MENNNIKALSKYRFEKALSNIQIAKKLYKSDEYSAA